jgi:rod shape-determining protein MreD
VAKFFTLPASDFIFSALSTSFLVSLIFGIMYFLFYLVNRMYK